LVPAFYFGITDNFQHNWDTRPEVFLHVSTSVKEDIDQLRMGSKETPYICPITERVELLYLVQSWIFSHKFLQSIVDKDNIMVECGLSFDSHFTPLEEKQ
jgi:hypothetical protein